MSQGEGVTSEVQLAGERSSTQDGSQPTRVEMAPGLVMPSNSNLSVMDKSDSSSSVSTSNSVAKMKIPKGIRRGRNAKLKLLMIVFIIICHFLTKVNTQYPKTLLSTIYDLYEWNDRDNGSTYQLMTAAFQVSQAFTALVGYSLVNRWGYGFSLPLFAGILSVGTLVVSYGFIQGKLWAFYSFVLIGNLAMGFGVAPMKISYQALIKKWVRDSNLSFAMSGVLFATGGGLILCTFIPDILDGLVKEGNSKRDRAAEQMTIFSWSMFAAQSVAFACTFAIIWSDRKLKSNNPTRQDKSVDKSGNVLFSVMKSTFTAVKHANREYVMLVCLLIFSNVSLKPFNSFVASKSSIFGPKAIAINGGVMMTSPLIGMAVDYTRRRTVIMAVCSGVICTLCFLFHFFREWLHEHGQVSWPLLTAYYFCHTIFGVAFWPALTSAYSGGPDHLSQIGYLIGFTNFLDCLAYSLQSYLLKLFHIESVTMIAASCCATGLATFLSVYDWKTNWFLDGRTEWMDQFDDLESRIKCEATKSVWVSLKEKLKHERDLYGPRGLHFLKLLNEIQPAHDEQGRVSLLESLEVNLLRSGEVCIASNG